MFTTTVEFIAQREHETRAGLTWVGLGHNRCSLALAQHSIRQHKEMLHRQSKPIPNYRVIRRKTTITVTEEIL